MPVDTRGPLRSTYQLSGESRWKGLAGTMAIYAVLLAGFFVTISTTIVSKPAPASLTVVNTRPSASPPPATPQDREAPRPMEKQESPQEPPQVVRIKPLDLPLPPVTVPLPASSRPVDPAPKEAETAAPKTLPAPPAPLLASEGRDTWEGRVLAQLNKSRRYPRSAMSQRNQGVPWIRFVMNREGNVLTAVLERSSGYPVLDREALSLPKRAQPLPKPPEEVKGDTIELVVPVEFFLR